MVDSMDDRRQGDVNKGDHAWYFDDDGFLSKAPNASKFVYWIGISYTIFAFAAALLVWLPSMLWPFRSLPRPARVVKPPMAIGRKPRIQID
jgi:hypothetical protein